MVPSLFKIDQDGGLEVLGHPKRAKQRPGKRPGGAQGSQNGSQEGPGHLQILPKWRQHGIKMGSKTGPTWDQIPSPQKHRFFIVSDQFSTYFPSFSSMFGVHCCIHFSIQFLMVLNMFFLSKIQMCCSAETLKKLISHLFLRCFVKVAIFRTRQSKHQIFAESIKFKFDVLIKI